MKRFTLLAICSVTAITVRAQSAGQAEISAQGYYLRNNSELVSSTSGSALKFEQFFPNIGLFRGNLEAYRSGGAIQPADNFLELQGLVWEGLRWNATGGDFRSPGTLLPNPFTNMFFPELNARGIQLRTGNDKMEFSFFYGSETLLAGPRIPFRIDVPQKVIGGGVRRRFGNFETGVRAVHLESTAKDILANPLFFSSGKDFLSVDNLTTYASYAINDHFRFYGEATAAKGEMLQGESTGQTMSYFFGPVWETARVTVRANYADLGRAYYPVAGYWIGNRRGPYGELRIRPARQVEFFGSASRYETTEKDSTLVPFMRSTATSTGVSVNLPLRFNVSGQLSQINFLTSDAASGSSQQSFNRQWIGTLSRPVRRHSLRLTARNMDLRLNGIASVQRSAEFEDIFQIRGFMLGAAVRGQQMDGSERRNSVFFRGSAQFNWKRLNAYGYYEGGQDLINRTLFATNTASTTVFSATMKVSKTWSVQGEAFRSRLLAELNPESLFVQANQTLAINPLLSQFNQWSFLFRVSHSFHWGADLAGGSLDLYTRQRIQITGPIEGFVTVAAGTSREPAPGITVTLESGRSAVTDANGKFRFDDIPEGPHVVKVDMELLPAEFNPGETTKADVVVGPRKVARAQLDLYSLSGFQGHIAAEAGSRFDTLEGILIRLDPGDRYTTTLRDGSFAFFNLPDGSYQVSLSEPSLPSGAELIGSGTLPLEIRNGVNPAPLVFQLRQHKSEERPVRKVLDESIQFPDR